MWQGEEQGVRWAGQSGGVAGEEQGLSEVGRALATLTQAYSLATPRNHTALCIPVV